MKIYFAGSIRGGRDDKKIYFDIIALLSKHGTVLTEHIGHDDLNDTGEENYSDQYIYDRDLKFIDEADVVVAEVTTPSLGVGYEIATAEHLHKKILCLFRSSSEKRLSAMIQGCKQVTIKNYQSISDVENILEEFLKS